MTNRCRPLLGCNHKRLFVRRTVFHPSDFLGMHFPPQINHLIGSEGCVLEQLRALKLVTSDQFGENLNFSDAGRKGSSSPVSPGSLFLLTCAFTPTANVVAAMRKSAILALGVTLFIHIHASICMNAPNIRAHTHTTP
jgi:hypothetical protein